jgi:hypothetical protein
MSLAKNRAYSTKFLQYHFVDGVISVSYQDVGFILSFLIGFRHSIELGKVAKTLWWICFPPFFTMFQPIQSPNGDSF